MSAQQWINLLHSSIESLQGEVAADGRGEEGKQGDTAAVRMTDAIHMVAGLAGRLR